MESGLGPQGNFGKILKMVKLVYAAGLRQGCPLGEMVKTVDGTGWSVSWVLVVEMITKSKF